MLTLVNPILRGVALGTNPLGVDMHDRHVHLDRRQYILAWCEFLD
jgi:hypothetical protein